MTFTRHLGKLALAIGLAIVAWIGAGFLGTNPLAFGITVLIAGAYLLGAIELSRFQAQTAALDAALDAPPPSRSDEAAAGPDLDKWLARLPAPLRAAVRRRVEGGHSALPGPALTPYLLGLLVMLGMLGTFLGMVVTFQGTVAALQASTDLNAMRQTLAAPIRGLGLSFGTSVAGVAASAMLGLVSAFARRQRLEAGRRLDDYVVTTLRSLTPAQRAADAVAAMQAQADALPQVIARVDALMTRLDTRDEAARAAMSAEQQAFHQATTQTYRALADDVGRALRDSVIAGATAVGERVTPVIAAAMQSITEANELRTTSLVTDIRQALADTADRMSTVERERLEETARALASIGATLERQWRDAAESTRTHHEAAHRALEASVAELARGFASSLQAVNAGLDAHTTRTSETLAGLLARTEALIDARANTESDWQAQQAARTHALTQALRDEFRALRDAEAERGAAAVERLGALEAAVSGQLARLGATLEAPMARLIDSAAEAPRAASGVLEALRREAVRLAERENAALDLRAELLSRFDTLTVEAAHGAQAQRAALDDLVASTRSVLDASAERFAEAIRTQSDQATSLTSSAASNAAAMAALAESFGLAADRLGDAGAQLVESLDRIQAALGDATTRSDEQLAYYVNQAREVIDLSLTAQKDVVEALQRLQAERTAVAKGSAS